MKEHKLLSTDQARRQKIICRVISGRLLECAGSIKTARWALDDGLTHEMKIWLSKVERELLQRAMAAETEANLYESQTSYAIAGELPKKGKKKS